MLPARTFLFLSRTRFGRPILFNGTQSHVQLPLSVLDKPLGFIRKRLRRRMALVSSKKSLAACQKIYNDRVAAFERDFGPEC